MKRFAILLPLLLTGCGPGSPLYDLPITPGYSPALLRTLGGEVPLLPGGMDDAQAEALSAAMAGWHRRVKLTFPVQGDTGESFGYRVVARLEGARNRVQDACYADAPIRMTQGDGTRHLGLAFCRGKRLTTAVTARLDEGMTFDSAAFAERVDDMMLLLFPRRSIFDDGGGDRSHSIMP